MKKSACTLFIVSLLLVFSSCEDVVQVKLDEGSKLYVIDAFITNQNQLQTVVITQSDNYFSNQEAPIVSGAQVTLTDLTTNAQYSFTYSTKGRYVYDAATQPSIDAINHVFELKVKIDGSDYTATATQKRTAVIDSIVRYTTTEQGALAMENPFTIVFYGPVIKSIKQPIITG